MTVPGPGRSGKINHLIGNATTSVAGIGSIPVGAVIRAGPNTDPDDGVLAGG